MENLEVMTVDMMAEALKKALEKEKNVFDDYVPIVENTYGDRKVLYVYLSDNIQAPYNYNELCHKLRMLTSKDTVNFYVNNGGGIIDSIIMLTDTINKCEATINVHLSGTVASASTFFPMVADNLEVAPYTHFMIHNYSGGVHGKGKEAKDQMDFINEEIGKTFKSIYAGFLTEEEIEYIINDNDKWMGREEVLERWNNRKRYLQNGNPNQLTLDI